MKKALITGITGQDGAYLAELLLSKGYEVHGIKRRSSLLNTGRVDHLYKEIHSEGNRFHLHYGDMTDSANLIKLVADIQPDEIYNLAAQSHVKVSFDMQMCIRDSFYSEACCLTMPSISHEKILRQIQELYERAPLWTAT